MIATTAGTDTFRAVARGDAAWRQLEAAPQPTIGRSKNAGAASHGSHRGTAERSVGWRLELMEALRRMRCLEKLRSA